MKAGLKKFHSHVKRDRTRASTGSELNPHESLSTGKAQTDKAVLSTR